MIHNDVELNYHIQVHYESIHDSLYLSMMSKFHNFLFLPKIQIRLTKVLFYTMYTKGFENKTYYFNKEKNSLTINFIKKTSLYSYIYQGLILLP